MQIKYITEQVVTQLAVEKYKKIIAPIVTGKGIMMDVTANKQDYIGMIPMTWWIVCLRLVLASQKSMSYGS